MKYLDGILVAVCASAAAGFFQAGRVAYAVVPAVCSKYECKSVHAHWGTSYLNNASCYFVVGQTVNSNKGWDIFTPTSVEKDPTVLSGKYDFWLYQACSPMCGKSDPGSGTPTWQMRQEVARAGMGAKVDTLSNADRYICTAANGTGPLASGQSNANYNGDVPPGATE